MKRLVVLSICLLLASTATAKADILGTTTTGNIVIGSVWDTTSDANYNYVSIYADAFNGPAAGSQINLIEGTWTAVGGKFAVAGKTATNNTFQTDTTWAGLDAGASSGMPTGYSAVNFSAFMGGSLWARDNGTATTSSIIAGGWYDNSVAANDIMPVADRDNDQNADGYSSDLIGIFKVTKSTTAVTFSSNGQTGTYGIGYTYNNGTVETTNFTTATPEPSSIALLGCGLFGLLAYAWRKRK
jgi:hypothetical protein